MQRSSKKLLPIGSNMNDAAYPFRGEHRLENVINHGHSGVVKTAPTSISMRISGANLVIEQVQTPKGVELECELGVDGGIPRPVSLQQASAFMVPGDGHDYNLIAAVKAAGAATKQYCKLTFNGSEGTSVLRVRAPEGCSPDAVYIVADGRRLRPTAGWFRIPIQTRECALVANLLLASDPPQPFSFAALAPRPSGTRSPLSQRTRSPLRGRSSSAGAAATAALPPPPETSHFFLETVRAPAGPPNQPPLLTCGSTGQVIPLAVQGTVAVPLDGAPYRLQLPPAGGGDAVGASSALPAPVVSGDVPDVETRVQQPLIPNAESTDAAAMPTFVASAPNFTVQLTGDGGNTVMGAGVAALPLVHRRAQTVQIVLRDAQGRVVLRQRSHVPALESPPAELQLKDDGAGGLAVSAAAGARLTVGGVVQADPTAAAALPRVIAQQVVVEQSNPGGSVSRASLEVAAKSGGGGPAGAPAPALGGPAPVPVPLAVGGAPAPTPVAAAVSPAPQRPAAPAGPDKWILDLCDALQKPNVEDQRRLLQTIQPSTLPGMTIVNFVREQLTRQPSAISFTVSRNGLEAVQCPGCSVTAAIGNEPARQLPSFGSLALQPGRPALLTATQTSTKRPVAACRVQMSTMNAGAGTAPGMGSAFAQSPGGDGKADTDLVNRLVDLLMRHNNNAQLVGNELSSMSTAVYSAQGRRLVPQLATCLRSASASGAAAAAEAAKTQAAAVAAAAVQAAAEEIFFSCGAGYLDNVYTAPPQYHLFGAVDDQPAQVLQQRGRLPAQGALEGEHKPHFIRLTARDPTTGAVKVERTVTVLGVSPAAPAPQAAVPVSTPPPPAATQAPPEGAARDFDRGAGLMAPIADRSAPVTAVSVLGESTPIPYMDVGLQAVGQDVQARFLCPPHLRIVCDVDGIGGNTGRSDFVAKMLASRFHRVNLSLIDTYGRVVFQQKLDVPAMTSPLWGLAVQHNGMSVDPETGSLATASVDRAPERPLQGNYVSFDASVPHFVHLRKYLNGIHGSCAGEVSLRLPGLTLPPELEEVTRIMRRRANGQLTDPQAKEELQQVRARCTTPSVVELITSILDGWPTQRGGDGGGTAVVYASGRESPSSRVFFRLTGSD